MAFDPNSATLLEDEPTTKKKKFDPSSAFLADDKQPEQMTQQDFFAKKFDKPERQPSSIERAVFPSLTSPEEWDKKPTLKDAPGAALKGGLDILSLPVRALGTMRTNPNTGDNYKITDSASAMFRPEIEKVKGAIDKLPEAPTVTTDRAGSAPSFNPMGSFSMQQGDTGNKEVLKGGVELAGSIASDPTLFTGLAAKGLSAPVKKLGVDIESSVLGKGNKSILKKNNLTNDQVAETALKNDVGGSLQGTINKVEDKFEVVENQIDDVINKAQQKDPNLTLNPDIAVNRVLKRISDGDPMFFGQTEEAVKALRSLNDDLLLYKMNGPQSISKYQEIKRIIGKKGFKKGSAPTIDTQAKEQIYDLVNLEMKDELEKVVPEIGELNQVYKQLIPVKQMAENRLPTAQSNDLFGLGNILTTGGGMLAGLASQGMSPGALVPAIGANLLYRASKSGNVAQGLYNTGKGLGKAPVQAVPGLASAAQNFSLDPEIGKRRFGK